VQDQGPGTWLSGIFFELLIKPFCMLRLFFTAIAICSLAGVLAAQQTAPSSKNVRAMKVYVQTPSGGLSEVPHESAFGGQERIRDLPNGVATPSNVVNILRVPGPHAKTRFTAAVPIELWAEMPAGTDPRQLELYHSRFMASNASHMWNRL
jgi:hypothetical protein